MNPERATLEGRDLAAVVGTGVGGTAQEGHGRIQIATGEAVSTLQERFEQEAHLMNMLTATILVLGRSANTKELETVIAEAQGGNYQSITDLFHSQPAEVRQQIAQKVAHVRIVNHYVAFGINQGYWGGVLFSKDPKDTKGEEDLLRREEDIIHEVKMGFLLNGNMPAPVPAPQGADFAQMVAEVETRVPLSDFDREQIHNLELELAFRVPEPEKLIQAIKDLNRVSRSIPPQELAIYSRGKQSKPGRNYVQLLSARNLILAGVQERVVTHAVAVLEDGKKIIIPVKQFVTKFRRPDGSNRLVTLLKPVDGNGDVIPLESL